MDAGADRRFVHMEVQMLRKDFGTFIYQPYYNSHDSDLHCPICGEGFRAAYPYAEHYVENHKTFKAEADARRRARRAENEFNDGPGFFGGEVEGA